MNGDIVDRVDEQAFGPFCGLAAERPEKLCKASFLVFARDFPKTMQHAQTI